MADVEVQFGANIQPLIDAARKTTEAIGKLGADSNEQFEHMSDTVKEAVEAFGVGFGIDQLKEWVETQADLGEQMEQSSARLGTTAQQTSLLSGEAALTGTAFQSLEQDMARFNLNLGSAGVDTSRAAQALKALGLSAREFRGKSIADQLELLAEATSKFADGGNKTAAILGILGRSGAEILPFLDRGAEGMRELANEAERSGAVMSDDMVEAFTHTSEDIHEATLAAQGFSNQLFANVNPAIDALIREFTQYTEAMNASAAQGREASAVLGAIGAIAKSVTTGFLGLGAVAKSTFSLLITGASEVENAFVGVGAVIKDAWDRNWTGLAADARTSLGWMKDDAKQFGADQVAIFKSSFDQIKEMWAYDPQAEAMQKARQRLRSAMGGGGESGASEDLKQIGNAAGGATLNVRALESEFSKLGKPQAGTMEIGGNKGAQDALEAQNIALNAEIEHYKSVEQQKQDLIQSEVKMKILSAEQGRAATEAALSQELTATLAVYKQKEALYAAEPAKLAEVQAKQKALQDDYNKQIGKLNLEAAEQTADAWNKAFETFNSSFETNLEGVIKGTESLRQAWQSMFSTLLLDAIKYFVNLGLQDTESTALRILNIGKVTTATQAGATAQAAAQNAGSAGGLFANAGKILSTLAADAKAVFGGVFAFLSPTMGPAAAAPAAAASASVLAFASGAWELGGDHVAMVHQGEMIVPARDTPWAQSRLSGEGGGGSTHYHTHNWNTTINKPVDSGAVIDAINDNAGKVGKILGRQFNLRPA